jgi:hypothetical protein
MKSCPLCGRKENEIEMTTSITPVEMNVARCPCGWVGTVDGLKVDGKKAAPEANGNTDEPDAEPKGEAAPGANGKKKTAKADK